MVLLSRIVFLESNVWNASKSAFGNNSFLQIFKLDGRRFPTAPSVEFIDDIFEGSPNIMRNIVVWIVWVVRVCSSSIPLLEEFLIKN